MRSTAERTRERSHHPEAEIRGEGLTIELSSDGRLIVRTHGERHAVTVSRCFPWSRPSTYLSLRNGDGEEVALIEDPVTLDTSSRAALETALDEASFVFGITGVSDLDEEVELRTWRVRTDRGERRFQTRLDDWPRRLPDGGLLIRDVTGDLYRIDDVAGLDRRSRSLLWAFVD